MLSFNHKHLYRYSSILKQNFKECMFTYLQKARNAFPRVQQQLSHSLLFCWPQKSSSYGIQRAVGLSWLTMPERKELDFILPGREWMLQTREDPPSQQSKQSRTMISEPFPDVVDLICQHWCSDRVHQFSSVV